MSKTYRIENNKVVEVTTVPETEEVRAVDSARIQEKINNLQAHIDKLTIEKTAVEAEEAKLEPEE
jgi:hypothetical protein